MTRVNWRLLVWITLVTTACSDPAGPLSGQRWALVSIDGAALPARPSVFTYTVLADTLEFDLESSQWAPRPLARGSRVYRATDGSRATEEWWYTYDASRSSTFDIRALCADGDLAASCIDGRGTATVDDETLTIRFRESGLGLLRYRRVR